MAIHREFAVVERHLEGLFLYLARGLSNDV